MLKIILTSSNETSETKKQEFAVTFIRQCLKTKTMPNPNTRILNLFFVEVVIQKNTLATSSLLKLQQQEKIKHKKLVHIWF